MADVKQFTDEVLDQFAKSITDRVFLMVQKDKKLMKDYLDLVDEKSLNTVNTELGKAVKNKFSLKNFEPSCREDNPESILIQSYEQHKF